MNWEEYKLEIELIKKQNNDEHDLYTVIANILKERKAFNNKSVRCVGNRRRTKSKKEKLFWGLKGFPDFIILDTDYVYEEKESSKALCYGVVEAKALGESILVSRSDKLQLVGHLLWFDRVIYTNGIEWRFYENTWKLQEQDINKMHDLSYEKYAKRPKNKDVDNQVDEFLEKRNIDDLEYKAFVLRKNMNENEKWDKDVWNALIGYLDNYYEKMGK